MIRNESDYKEAVRRVEEEQVRLEAQRRTLEGMGLSADEIRRALDPIRSFHLQLEEEVASYEKLKRGEFGELTSFRGIGHLLISLRIARGMSQRELAARLDIDESQVSRDERNEYRGIRLERATQILDVLGAELHTTVESKPLPEPKTA